MTFRVNFYADQAFLSMVKKLLENGEKKAAKNIRRIMNAKTLPHQSFYVAQHARHSSICLPEKSK